MGGLGEHCVKPWVWIGSIAGAVGAIVGLMPSSGYPDCGSAWFPACPVIHQSSTAISVALILVAGAAIIAGLAVSGRKN
jgi:hypothetical protein